jgi:hypothetical protein
MTVTIRLSMTETSDVQRKVQYPADDSGTLVTVIVFGKGGIMFYSLS